MDYTKIIIKPKELKANTESYKPKNIIDTWDDSEIHNAVLTVSKQLPKLVSYTLLSYLSIFLFVWLMFALGIFVPL